MQRRGLVLAAIALTLAIGAPELAAPAGATIGSASPTGSAHVAASPRPSHVELTAKKRKRKKLTPAQKRLAIEKYLRAHPKAAARARVVAAKKKGKAKTPAARRAAIRRALLAKRLKAAKKTTKAKAAAARLAAARRRAALSANKKKASSLSLPTLALLAISPFALMAAFLLTSDYMRRRPPKKRRASLVITRVGGR